jgi:hypothetical protein
VPTATGSEAPSTPTGSATTTDTESPTGTTEPVETREPDPDAVAFAHEALFGPEVLGETWSISSEDEFDDEDMGFVEDDPACAEINRAFERAIAEADAARIGRAQREMRGPDDPGNIFGTPEVEQEIVVFEDPTMPESIVGLYRDVLEGGDFAKCFEDTILASADPETEGGVETRDPSAGAPNGGVAAAYQLTLTDGEFTLVLVQEIYAWVSGNAAVLLSFSGDEPMAEVVEAGLAALTANLE